MECLARIGLMLDIRTERYEQNGITIGEAKAIAYLFNINKSIFKKCGHIYKLKMSDRHYWLSLRYDPQS